MNADIYAFLSEVAMNNNRPWLAQNRERYDALRHEFNAELQRLIDACAVWEPAVRYQTPAQAAYRFYRDTRFSPDKRPFKTYFSAAIAPRGKSAPYAGYYIQIDPDEAECGLYAGLWCPDSAMLKKMRHAIVDNIEEWQQIVHDPFVEAHCPGWSGDTLRTAPQGWNKNHPYIEYLRLKHYGKRIAVPPSFFTRADWPEQAADLLHHLQPMVEFINYSLDE